MALMLVALCAALEAWLSGPKPFRVLASLKQPRWALPIWGWVIVGVAFYAIMLVAAAAMLQARQQGAVALAMIVAVMVTDGVWNFLLFRRRRLDWAYRYLFPYTVLVAATSVVVFTVDGLAGGLIAVYLAFLPYDFAWTRALAALNPQLPVEPGRQGRALPHRCGRQGGNSGNNERG
jgi:tryptophan-rich sensory protein